MDPNIMKLLEDDEDDAVHSGADVEAFTAALNRDIEGETNISQTSDFDGGVLPHGNKCASEMFSRWQNSSQKENITSRDKQEPPKNLRQEQLSSEMESKKQESSQLQQLGYLLECSQESDQLQQQTEHNPPQSSQNTGIQIAEHTIVNFPELSKMRHPDQQHQYLNLQKMKNPQVAASEQSDNPNNDSKQIQFRLILRAILSNVDKDTYMQVQTLYNKMTRDDEFKKGDFLMRVRQIVGPEMLFQVLKLNKQFDKAEALTGRNSQTGSRQLQVQPQTSSQQQQAKKLPTCETNIKEPKKTLIGQKKPRCALGSPPPVVSKKQKVSGSLMDQSVQQLNDVTAFSGVDLREEEEQLLSGPKDESRALEATRRVVHEEEDRLILQKIPLQKKLAKIMSKCGIKSISSDLERALTLCVEERMRGLISSLIRVSKQRVDMERPKHRTLATPDVWHQILLMNRKSKEDWEKKKTEEAEKVRKLNEGDEKTATHGEKDKNEGRTKTLKANKEEDDKRRTAAANIAARVAFGGYDMVSKWKLDSKQAQQKHKVRRDMTSATQFGKDVSHRASPTSGQNMEDNQEIENRTLSTSGSGGSGRNFGVIPVAMPRKNTHTISIEDVITVLEKEPQMSKSTLVYRLYEKMRGVDSKSE